MPSKLLRNICVCSAVLAMGMAHAQEHAKTPQKSPQKPQAQTQDIHIKKSITVGGNFVSSSESSIKDARERTVSQAPNGSTITLTECDLQRTLTPNEQAQTYFVTPDAQQENAAKAAALAT